MKFRVQVGSFCTRLITRHITVEAPDKETAREKAIDKFVKEEVKLSLSVDVGSPRVDSVEVVE